MKKVAVIGLFMGNEEVSDGQSIKTRILTEEIVRSYGADNVVCVDTYGWKKHPFHLLWKSVAATKHCQNVIMMTDAGGIRVYPWLLVLSKLGTRCKLHYVVVGGWLVKFLKKHTVLARFLRKFDCIYVETNAMLRGLQAMGFNNLHLMPNFKVLQPLREDELIYSNEPPYKLCIFSRVMREKGIEDAIEAVKEINRSFNQTVYTLDIYGQVDSLQKAWFDNLTTTFTSEIHYRGVVAYDQSVGVLKDYYALLFPTKFYTEGIPGTIIDAYAAGIPVVASEWENVSDMIEPGKTGITYPFDDFNGLKDALISGARSPEVWNEMKRKCLIKAREYLPDKVIGILLNQLI